MAAVSYGSVLSACNRGRTRHSRTKTWGETKGASEADAGRACACAHGPCCSPSWCGSVMAMAAEGAEVKGEMCIHVAVWPEMCIRVAVWPQSCPRHSQRGKSGNPPSRMHRQNHQGLAATAHSSPNPCPHHQAHSACWCLRWQRAQGPQRPTMHLTWQKPRWYGKSGPRAGYSAAWNSRPNAGGMGIAKRPLLHLCSAGASHQALACEALGGGACAKNRCAWCRSWRESATGGGGGLRCRRR
jgi:hypothetical protein